MIAAAPAPTTAPVSAPVQRANARVDPCGGAQELLKKYLAASPCVFVAGQVSVQMTYAGTNTPANGILTTAGENSGVAGSRQVFSYPNPLLNLGLTRNSQIAIAYPSYTQISGSHAGAIAAGAADMMFSYKQLAYVDSARGILGGFSVDYEAPTGSAGLSAPGPAYTVNPLLNIALNARKNLGVSLAFPATNAVTGESPSGVQRGWIFAPQAVPYWRSPGGTLLALVIRHDFTAGQTALTINSAQLLSRQFQLQGTYGAVNTPIDFANAAEGIIRVSGTAYASSFTLGFSYMLGTSEAPAP